MKIEQKIMTFDWHSLFCYDQLPYGKDHCEYDHPSYEVLHRIIPMVNSHDLSDQNLNQMLYFSTNLFELHFLLIDHFHLLLKP